jgi:hypothetical protein
MTFQYFSKEFLDKNCLDDDARFWVGLYEQIELNPIRDYTFEIPDEDSYHHTISLDLDTRVSALLDLVKQSEYNKRINKFYLIKQIDRMIEKCIKNEREDLVELIESIIT